MEISSRRENFKSRALPLEFFSFELHRTTVCDSLASAYPWKAEVNGFGAYHGKAQQKDNIREGTVGHQIFVHSTVLPFQDFGRAIVNLISFKEWKLSDKHLLIFFFWFYRYIRDGLFLIDSHWKSQESFQRHSCTSPWALKRIKSITTG